MKVGIVGAGQLARMMLEAASALGISCVVLAESPGDAAVATGAEIIFGSPSDPEAMHALAERCDVITFDHELVDLSLLGALEDTGTVIRPSSRSLLLAVDKAAMRKALHDAGLPTPAFEILDPGDEGDARNFGATNGWPLVIKAARGGYDGRGVFLAKDLDEATQIIASLHDQGISALLEEQVAIETELAALVARTPSGEHVSWRVVETAQVDGVCREVRVPGAIPDEVVAGAAQIASTIAELADVTGVMAVELFVTEGRLVINELAMRPHNSGHWTQDGSVTSQFENHLRAVLDLPLGDTAVTSPHVASVNVFGGPEKIDPNDALRNALGTHGAHIHLYGKEHRPGRKLGHVNVLGHNGEEVRSAAWRAAIALGTPVLEGHEEATR